MTDRAEIERLLNQTGRTLEGLPTQSDYFEYDVFDRRFAENERLMVDSGFTLGAPFMFHQSDVIELLVGALKDALEKPIQKPLTLEELQPDVVAWLEFKDNREECRPIRIGYNDVFGGMTLCYKFGLGRRFFVDDSGYNVYWRAWASRPTDKERSAAKWEV